MIECEDDAMMISLGLAQVEEESSEEDSDIDEEADEKRAAF